MVSTSGADVHSPLGEKVPEGRLRGPPRTRHDHQGARFGGGRRVSAGQLQLPQLRRRAAGKPGLRPRTQSSLAVSRDGQALGAAQRLAGPAPADRRHAASWRRAPTGGPRASPIKAVVLTNGDVDHVAGLLSLREGFAFTLYASARVLEALAANSIFNVLDARPGAAGRARGSATAARQCGVGLGLTVEAFPVPGKVALYLEDPAAGPDVRHARGRHHRP